MIYFISDDDKDKFIFNGLHEIKFKLFDGGLSLYEKIGNIENDTGLKILHDDIKETTYFYYDGINIEKDNIYHKDKILIGAILKPSYLTDYIFITIYTIDDQEDDSIILNGCLYDLHELFAFEVLLEDNEGNEHYLKNNVVLVSNNTSFKIKEISFLHDYFDILKPEDLKNNIKIYDILENKIIKIENDKFEFKHDGEYIIFVPDNIKEDYFTRKINTVNSMRILKIGG